MGEVNEEADVGADEETNDEVNEKSKLEATDRMRARLLSFWIFLVFKLNNLIVLNNIFR